MDMGTPVTAAATILRRHWLSIVLIAGVMGALVYVATGFMAPSYRAHGVLLVDNTSLNIPEVQVIQADRSYLPAQPRSEMRMVTSPQILRQAVVELGLDKEVIEDPDHPLTPDGRIQQAVIDLGFNLDVDDDPKSYAIDVSAEADTPERSAQIVNTVMKYYVANQVERKTESLRNAANFLEERRNELQRDVDRTEQAFAAAVGQPSQAATEQGYVASQELADLTLTRRRLQLEAETLSDRLATADASIKSGEPARITGAISSQVVSQLAALATEQENDMARMRAQLGRNHPDVVNLSGRITQTKRDLIQAAVDATRADRDAVVALKSRIARINADIEALSGTSAASARGLAETERIKRDLLAKQQLLTTYDERLAQALATVASGTPDVRIASAATAPLEPVSPRRTLLAAFATLLAGLVAFTVRLVSQLARGRMNGPAEVELVTGMRALAAIPWLRRRRVMPLPDLVVRDIEHPVSETLRGAIQGIRQHMRPGQCITVLVTSAAAGEGKTSMSLALGRIAAADGWRVAVLGCDMRRSNGHVLSLPGLQDSPASPLATKSENHTVRFSIRQDQASGMTVILGEAREQGPAHRLVHQRLGQLVGDARQYFDILILDTPPALHVTDALELAQVADGAVLVVSDREAKRPSVLTLMHRIENAGCPIFGFIYNGARTVPKPYGYAGYRSLALNNNAVAPT